MSKRLDFDGALRADMRRKRTRRPRIGLRGLTGLAVLALLVVALTGGASALFTSFALDRGLLIDTTVGFLAAVASENPEAALRFCAEGDVGAQHLAAEDARTFQPGYGASTIVAAPDRAARLALLSDMRAELTQAGVDWAALTPLAFGGTSARVFDADLMQKPASVLVGNVYFSSADKLYAIEVSLRECLGTFVVVDVWRWETLNITPKQVKSHATEQHRALKREPALPDGPAELDRPRQVFVKLPETLPGANAPA